MNEIQARLERLERENRMWKWGVVVLGLIGVAGGAMAQQERRVGPVDVTAVRLLDAKGRVRAALTVDEQDVPALVFYDTEGKLRAGVSDRAVGFFKADGKQQVTLSTASGISELALFDSAGNSRMRFGVGESVGLTLYDAHRVGRVGLSVSGTGAPGLMMLDHKEQRRAVLGLSADTQGLLLMDEAGHLRAGLSLIDEKPQVGLWDAEGKAVFAKP